jgi:hypothetical protein
VARLSRNATPVESLPWLQTLADGYRLGSGHPADAVEHGTAQGRTADAGDAGRGQQDPELEEGHDFGHLVIAGDSRRFRLRPNDRSANVLPSRADRSGRRLGC